MFFEDPLQLAVIFLAFTGGVFLGKIFAFRWLGSCLTVVIGLFVLAVVLSFLLVAPLAFVESMSLRLGEYIAMEFGSFIAFLAGLAVGYKRPAPRPYWTRR